MKAALNVIETCKAGGFPLSEEQEMLVAGSVAVLVEKAAQDERERLKWDGLHSCHSECDRPACVHTRKAVEAEREACAVIAFNAKTYIEAAKAIRARSK